MPHFELGTQWQNEQKLYREQTNDAGQTRSWVHTHNHARSANVSRVQSTAHYPHAIFSSLTYTLNILDSRKMFNLIVSILIEWADIWNFFIFTTTYSFSLPSGFLTYASSTMSHYQEWVRLKWARSSAGDIFLAFAQPESVIEQLKIQPTVIVLTSGRTKTREILPALPQVFSY